MPISIVNNLSSMYAQQAIRTRNDGMTLATQRLSSGQRVFNAAQDAAAVAVGTSLNIENSGLKQAQLNVTGASSTLQIADGAMGQLSDTLTRMKVLATQAASGNLSDGDRVTINQEFQALKSEVQRIAAVTNFNGVPLLTGKPSYTLASGVNTALDGVAKVDFDASKVSDSAAFRYDYDATSEQLTLTRSDQGTTTRQTIDVTNLLDNVAGKGNQLKPGQQLELNFNALGVKLTLNSAFDRTADIEPVVTDNTDANVTVTTPTFAPQVTGLPGKVTTALAALSAATYNYTTGALALNTVSNGTTVTLAGVPNISYGINGAAPGASGAASGDLVGANTTVDVFIDNPDGGAPLKLGRLSMANVTTSGAGGGPLLVPVGQGLMSAKVDATKVDPLQLTYKVGTGITSSQDLVSVTIPAMTTQALGLTDTTITTGSAATVAMQTISDALTTLVQGRATLGAQQSRMETIGRNLSVVVENNETARSGLLDADAAQEITNLTTDQAMLQVGVSMLSQANRMSQMLLDLLKG